MRKHYIMKTYLGAEVKLHEFLISALDTGEWSASRSGHITSREKAHDIYCSGRWVDPHCLSGHDGKGINLCPFREMNRDLPVHSKSRY